MVQSGGEFVGQSWVRSTYRAATGNRGSRCTASDPSRRDRQWTVEARHQTPTFPHPRARPRGCPKHRCGLLCRARRSWVACHTAWFRDLVATLASTHTREVEPSPTRRRWTYSLLPGSPDASAFPRTAWISSARRALTTAPTDAFATTDPRGRVELRNALTTYLSRTRGVRVDPSCIVISASSGHGISLLARALGGTIAVDAFCLHLHRQLLADEGLLTVPISVDESGTCTDELASTSAESVLLTPTHQFPLGGPLTPARRATALEWATTTGGVIIEDDYDGEFRYDRKPVGALQGIAPQHVAYLALSARHCRRPFASDGWCCRTG